MAKTVKKNSLKTISAKSKKLNKETKRVKKNVCNFCGWKTFWLSSLKCHVKSKHLFESFVCGYCDMTFTQWSNAIRHSKNKHSGLNPLIQKESANNADEPNDEKKNVANCDQIQTLATQNEDNVETCEAESCTTDKKLNGDNCVDVVEHNTSLTCHTCSYVGENDNELVDHVLSSHIRNTEEIEISFIDNWLDELETGHTQLVDREFNCQDCDFNTNNVEEYLQHIRMQHIPNLICPCGVTCEGHEGLIAHMQSVHISIHSCPLCKDEVTGYSNLEIHIKENHLN